MLSALTIVALSPNVPPRPALLREQPRSRVPQLQFRPGLPTNPSESSGLGHFLSDGEGTPIHARAKARAEAARLRNQEQSQPGMEAWAAWGASNAPQAGAGRPMRRDGNFLDGALGWFSGNSVSRGMGRAPDMPRGMGRSPDSPMTPAQVAVANAKARQAAYQASREQPPWNENRPSYTWNTVSSAWAGDETSRVERYSRKAAEYEAEMARPRQAPASPMTQGPSGAEAVANAKARQAAWKASREQPPWKENQPPWAWNTVSSAWSGDEMSRVERYSRNAAARAAEMDARDAMGRSRMPPPGYDEWDEGQPYDAWRGGAAPPSTFGQSVTTSAKAAWQAKQRSVAPWGAREQAPPPPYQGGGAPPPYRGNRAPQPRYDEYDWDEGRHYDEGPQPAPWASPVTIGQGVAASAKAAWQAKQANVAPGEWNNQAWRAPEGEMPAGAAPRSGARRRAPGGGGLLGGLASYFNPSGWGSPRQPEHAGARAMADDRFAYADQPIDRFSYADQPMTAGQSVTARAKAAWMAKQGQVSPGEWQAGQRRA